MIGTGLLGYTTHSMSVLGFSSSAQAFNLFKPSGTTETQVGTLSFTPGSGCSQQVYFTYDASSVLQWTTLVASSSQGYCFDTSACNALKTFVYAGSIGSALTGAISVNGTNFAPSNPLSVSLSGTGTYVLGLDNLTGTPKFVMRFAADRVRVTYGAPSDAVYVACSGCPSGSVIRYGIGTVSTSGTTIIGSGSANDMFVFQASPTDGKPTAAQARASLSNGVLKVHSVITAFATGHIFVSCSLQGSSPTLSVYDAAGATYTFAIANSAKNILCLKFTSDLAFCFGWTVVADNDVGAFVDVTYSQLDVWYLNAMTVFAYPLAVPMLSVAVQLASVSSPNSIRTVYTHLLGADGTNVLLDSSVTNKLFNCLIARMAYNVDNGQLAFYSDARGNKKYNTFLGYVAPSIPISMTLHSVASCNYMNSLAANLQISWSVNTGGNNLDPANNTFWMTFWERHSVYGTPPLTQTTVAGTGMMIYPYPFFDSPAASTGTGQYLHPFLISIAFGNASYMTLMWASRLVPENGVFNQSPFPTLCWNRDTEALVYGGFMNSYFSGGLLYELGMGYLTTGMLGSSYIMPSSVNIYNGGLYGIVNLHARFGKPFN